MRLATMRGRMITWSMFISSSPGKPINIVVVARFSGAAMSCTGLFIKAPIRKPTAAPTARSTMSKFRLINAINLWQHLLQPLLLLRNLFAISPSPWVASPLQCGKRSLNERKKLNHTRLIILITCKFARQLQTEYLTMQMLDYLVSRSLGALFLWFYHWKTVLHLSFFGSSKKICGKKL